MAQKCDFRSMETVIKLLKETTTEKSIDFPTDEEDYVEQESHDSATEESAPSEVEEEASTPTNFESEIGPQLGKKNCDLRPPAAKRPKSSTLAGQSQEPKTLRGKNNHLWYTSVEEPAAMKIPVDSFPPGPLGEARKIKSPYEAWCNLFDNDLIKKMTDHTNEEIRRHLVGAGINSKTNSAYKEIDETELRAYIGLLYFAGLQKTSRAPLDDLWDPTFGSNICRATMPLVRFSFISKCLRFDDKSTRVERRKSDGFAPIREVWEGFVANCKTFYSPGFHCTVHEQLVPFQGRCPFKVIRRTTRTESQNTRSNPERSTDDSCGLKIVTLTDSRTHYMINAEVYTGKMATQDNESVPSYFVRKLSEPIHGTGRNITCDRWFSSVELFDRMLEDHSVTMVGPLSKHEPEVPPVFGRGRVTSRFLFDKTKSLVWYTERSKARLVLSTLHLGKKETTRPQSMLAVEQRLVKEKKDHRYAKARYCGGGGGPSLSTLHRQDGVDADTDKPEVVTFYESTRGARTSEVCRRYSVARKTARWPARIFFEMLDRGGLNALVLHNFGRHNENMSRRSFVKSLVMDLVTPLLKKRLEILSLRRSVRVAILAVLGAPEPVNQPRREGKGRCVFCPRSLDRKSRVTCARCNLTVCEKHRIIMCQNCILE